MSLNLSKLLFSYGEVLSCFATDFALLLAGVVFLRESIYHSDCVEALAFHQSMLAVVLAEV